MGVCLSKFGQLRLVVDTRVCYSKAAYFIDGIRFNRRDTVNFLQIVPDRDGTCTSDHVGDAERDQDSRSGIRGRFGTVADAVINGDGGFHA